MLRLKVLISAVIGLLSFATATTAQSRVGDSIVISTNVTLLFVNNSTTGTHQEVLSTLLSKGDVADVEYIEKSSEGSWVYLKAYKATKTPGMTVYDKKGEGWIPAETLSKSCRRESSSDAVQATAIGPKEGLFSSLRRALNTPSTTTPQQDYDLYIQRETDKYERNVKSQQLQQQIQLDVAAEALRRQLKK